MEVVTVNIGDVIPYPENCKIHPRENIKLIKRSLVLFGQYKPLLVQRSTNYILVGNGTYQAICELKKVTVDIVYLDVNDEKAKLINIADNKISNLSTWNNNIIEKIKKFDADFICSLEFDNNFLKQFKNIEVDLKSLVKQNPKPKPATEKKEKVKDDNIICCPSCKQTFTKKLK